MKSSQEYRHEILKILRNTADGVELYVDNLFAGLVDRVWRDGQHVAPGAVDLYSTLWQLVHEGIIVPGHRRYGRLENNNETFRTFPYFAMTSYGREVLVRLRDDTDPADAIDYLDKLKGRAPHSDETVRRYVGEAVATFNSQNYLASAVLLGVAAESLLEQLYDAIGQHLPGGEPDYRTKLAAKRWASQRLEYARTRLEAHLAEFTIEFRTRVEQYLDMLAQVIKMSRDDVGHARPLRVDRAVASMNLVSFPVLAGIVDELIVQLARPCTSALATTT